MPHNAICAEIQVTIDEDSNSVLISENKARLLLGQLFSLVVSHVWRTAGGFEMCPQDRRRDISGYYHNQFHILALPLFGSRQVWLIYDVPHLP